MFMFVCIEVTQDITTGVIPLEAVRIPYQKGLTFGGESSLGSSSIGNQFILATPYMPTEKRGRTEIYTNS